MSNEIETYTPSELRDILVDLLIDNVNRGHEENNLHHCVELGNDIRDIQRWMNTNDMIVKDEYKAKIEEMSCNYDVIIDWS